MCLVELEQVMRETYVTSSDDTKFGTMILSDTLADYCQYKGYKYQREFKTGITRKVRDGRIYHGYVDFVVLIEKRMYCIEIDSGNKKWSLKKLIDSLFRGFIPVWIRWNFEINIDIPKEIYVIDLTHKI